LGRGISQGGPNGPNWKKIEKTTPNDPVGQKGKYRPDRVGGKNSRIWAHDIQKGKGKRADSQSVGRSHVTSAQKSKRGRCKRGPRTLKGGVKDFGRWSGGENTWTLKEGSHQKQGMDMGKKKRSRVEVRGKVNNIYTKIQGPGNLKGGERDHEQANEEDEKGVSEKEFWGF